MPRSIPVSVNTAWLSVCDRKSKEWMTNGNRRPDGLVSSKRRHRRIVYQLSAAATFSLNEISIDYPAAVFIPVLFGSVNNEIATCSGSALV